jgi:hypothetical protein
MIDDSKHSREAYRVEQSLAARHYEKEVQLLERKVKVLTKALESIAAPHLGEHLEAYFDGIAKCDVVECCILDTRIARGALKECEEMK